MKLKNEVTFTGYIDEKKTLEIYLNSDILVFSTVAEGFSMTIFNFVVADHLKEPDGYLWAGPKQL